MTHLLIFFTTGAPDPTAGGGIEDSSTWYFDESGVREQFRLDLAAIANGALVSGHNAFDGAFLQNNNSGMFSNLSNSHTYGRLFTNGPSEHGRSRSNRHTSTIIDEHSTKSRNFCTFLLCLMFVIFTELVT